MRAGRLARCGAILAAALTVLSGGAARAQEATNAEALRSLSLTLVNKARADNKLPPLQIGKEINEAAKYHAADMLRRNFYDHTSPEGKSVADRFRAAGGGRWQLTAENIARCTGCTLDAKTVEELQRGWMNSKVHRENILRRGISQFGFSIVAAPGKPLYAVQTFTGSGAPNETKPGERVKRVSDAEAMAKALEVLNKERKSAGRPALAENAALSKALRSILPKKQLETFSLNEIGNVKDALPEAERKEWEGLAVLAAACGGCGGEPTDADVRAFIQQWLGKARNREILLNAASSHLGFVLAASGQGKKVALAVLGKKQAK